MFDSHKFYLVTAALVVIGALNWGLVGAFDVDVVQLLGYPFLIQSTYIIIGLAALFHIFRRDYYLPFLGAAAFPCGPLQPKEPEGADTAVEIKTVPNANIVYWAAESATNKSIQQNPWVAYDKYLNSGVTRSNNDGRAVLKVRMPSAYKVPLRGTLIPHVHYRTCVKNGLLGPVQTAELK